MKPTKDKWEEEFDKELDNWLCENKSGLCNCKFYEVKDFIRILIAKERKEERERGRNEALSCIGNIISAKQPREKWEADKKIDDIEHFLSNPTFDTSAEKDL